MICERVFDCRCTGTLNLLQAKSWTAPSPPREELFLLQKVLGSDVQKPSGVPQLRLVLFEGGCPPLAGEGVAEKEQSEYGFMPDIRWGWIVGEDLIRQAMSDYLLITEYTSTMGG